MMSSDQLDALTYAVPPKPKARPWRTLAISLGLLALLPFTGLLWIVVLVVATILTVILSRLARLCDRFLAWWMGRLVWYGGLTQRIVGKAPPADTMKPVILADAPAAVVPKVEPNSATGSPPEPGLLIMTPTPPGGH